MQVVDVSKEMEKKYLKCRVLPCFIRPVVKSTEIIFKISVGSVKKVAQQKKYHDKKMGFGTFESRVHDDITSRVSFSEIFIKIKFSS